MWQFVTWRLADSLPQEQWAAWKEERDLWLKQHPRPWNDAQEREYHQRFSQRIEQWLDAGRGSCVLR